jgi:adenylyltransferase/sulfurtransferase
MLNDDDLERYARQAIMPAIGEEGQEQLLAARVLVVGAGGLGAPVIMYLAAAGIGTITIIDDDHVSRTDLNRQVIYKDSDVGLLKSRQAAMAASAINPAIHISQLGQRLSNGNVEPLLKAHDVVVDCTDNAEARYLLGDAAHAARQAACLWRGGAHGRTGFGLSEQRQRPSWQPVLSMRISGLCPMRNRHRAVPKRAFLGLLPGLVGTLQALETYQDYSSPSHAP